VVDRALPGGGVVASGAMNRAGEVSMPPGGVPPADSLRAVAAPRPRLVALLTSFNRRALTLAALDALHVAAESAQVALSAVLVDDGSTDGTADAVRERFAWVRVVAGGGDLFWCRGMHRAMAVGLGEAPDYLLWLNDDTLLRPDALVRLLGQQAGLAQQLGRPALLVGATAGPDGRLSYGGGRAVNRWRRFQYRSVWDAQAPLPCEVVNGNCVLLPLALAQQVGNLDPRFEHAMGDTDYALRTRRAGFPVYVAGGLVGDCANNPPSGTFLDDSLPLRRRWAAMLHRKGLPWRSWLHFTRRHGGLFWPAFFAWPYVRVLLSSLRPRRQPPD